MSTWTAEATVRTAGRVNAAHLERPGCAAPVSGCEVRPCGAQGVSVRLAVEAGTVAAAYEAALGFLASRLLPLLDGADLTDLRVLRDGPPAGSPRPAAPGTRAYAQITRSP